MTPPKLDENELELTAPERRKAHRRARNRAIRRRFTELYEQQRMRLDDVYERLAAEFFLSPKTVDKVLRSADDVMEPASHACK